jgi:acyl-CoA synthetase (AMP-forming)/AMP-acid ligase II
VTLAFRDLLAERAREAPDWPLVATPTGETLGLAELRNRADALACDLRAEGVQPHAPVGVFVPEDDVFGMAVANFALLLLDAVVVPLPDAWPPDLRHAVAADLGLEGVILENGAFTRSLDALGPGDSSNPARESPLREQLRRLVANLPISLIQFTSGATGRVKAAAFPAALDIEGDVEELRDASILVPIGVTATTASMVFTALRTGYTVLLVPSGTAGDVAAAVESLRVPYAGLIPHVALGLVRQRLHERHDLSSLRAVSLGGTHSAPELPAALSEALPGLTIVNSYSFTEGAPAMTRAVFGVDPPESVGKPLPGSEVLVAGPDGRSLPSGVVGEIHLRHTIAPRPVMLGPPPAPSPLRADGWVPSGDLGYLDEDGRLYVVDRQKDFVVRHDGSYATRVVEDALHRHAGVLEAAALGVPTGDDGEEELVAAVVPAADADFDDIASYVRSHLPPSFPLGEIRCIDYLPRTTDGKVMKHALRAAW